MEDGLVKRDEEGHHGMLDGGGIDRDPKMKTRQQEAKTVILLMGVPELRSWYSRSVFFFSSRRRHTRLQGDWSSDVCSSDLAPSRSTGRSWTASSCRPNASPHSSRTGSRLSVSTATSSHRRFRSYRWTIGLEIGRASCRERV